MALATRSGAFAVAAVTLVSACGADAPEGVAAPGLDGVPQEVTLEAPPLPTTTAVPTDAAVPTSTMSPTESSAESPAESPTSRPAPSTTAPASEPSDGADESGTEAGSEAGAATPATTIDDPFLRRGDEGPRVLAVQQQLIALEYLAPGGDTGVFDGATADALIDFQAQYGLVVDGIFGPESERALNAAAASVTDG